MAFTPIAEITKTAAHKSARQLSLEVKEALVDVDYVSCPVEALKSFVLDIEGENDEGAFGDNTIGQKITGKVIIYAADATVRAFVHELVTKTVQSIKGTTNSGISYTLEVASGTHPVVSFAYEKANLITDKTGPIVITLLISGYRDNLAIS